ncbi:hypothetical protein PPERSA_05580 [Pseudocohnilembus persalinus]|uniref:Major facilitator superfamily domain, general substrate transporter n=1 Tax=Pseudocohnilembus persalinus TaxID=266149 RepID=A0A0V0Q7M9_PSEPJ|nr:hypothetical protein PPERSA_05580 [Pseudocohnilembus persalinus]|eukprot:KRW98236.1 hypothetical protein PPERSA_05580 [Pseudocohnilembus persalinus]
MAVTMIVVGVPVGLLVFPAFNSLISYFPLHIGKATAVLLATVQVSTFFFQVVGFYIMNPSNKPANIPYYYDQQTNDNNQNDQENNSMTLFEEQIAKNYAKLLFVLGFCCGIFASAGGFFMSNKIEEELLLLKQQEKESEQNKSKNQSANLSINSNSNRNNIVDKAQWNEMQEISKIQNQKQDIEKKLEKLSSNNKESNNQKQNLQNNINITQKSNDYIQFDEEKQPELSVIQALLKKPFLIISFITMMIALYKMFLASNFKIYLLLKINDDQFLTYLSKY